jgi:hypothetical protein
MVRRVFLSLFPVVLVLLASLVSLSHAGGPVVGCAPEPAVCLPPMCAPPACPPPCGPPSCGPGFAPILDCFGACQEILGFAISLPAAIMNTILAPPRCGPPPCPPACPPMCAPAPCPPPMCGPPPMYCPAPAPITKCKPGPQPMGFPGVRYRSGLSPAPATSFMHATAPGTPVLPARPPGYLSMCRSMVEMPFKLASGVLCAVEPSCSGRPYTATLSSAVSPLFGGCW